MDRPTIILGANRQSESSHLVAEVRPSRSVVHPRPHGRWVPDDSSPCEERPIGVMTRWMPCAYANSSLGPVSRLVSRCDGESAKLPAFLGLILWLTVLKGSSPLAIRRRRSGWLRDDQHRRPGVCGHRGGDAAEQMSRESGAVVGAEHDQTRAVLLGGLDDPLPDR
jgi:hypothetical protein